MSNLVGSLTTVRHVETGDANFSLVQMPTLSVVDPAGAVGTTYTITDDPGISTSALIHTQRTQQSWALGGVYLFTWTIKPNDADILIRTEKYVATYYDVYADVRLMMRKSSAQLSDELLDLMLANTLFNFDLAYPSCPPYRSLTGQDRYWMDQFLANTIAVVLRIHPGFANPAGAITLIRESQLEYRFAAGSNFLGTIEENWLGNAYRALRNLVCVGQQLAKASANRSVFSAAGPTRGVESYLVQNEKQPLYTLLKSVGWLK